MENLFYYLGEFADNLPALFAFIFALSFVNVFFPPVPIEAIVLLGAYFAGLGRGNAVVLWLASSAGMAAGSTLLYLLARSRRERLLSVGFIRRQVSPEHLEKARSWFERYGMWTIFAGKLVPGLSFATSLGSGLFGLSKRKALPAFYFANLAFFAVVAAFGRYVGRDWDKIIALETSTIWMLVMAAAAAVLLVVVVILIARRNSQQP